MSRINRKLILPTIGLLLFARLSYHDLNPAISITEGNGRYVYWGSFRLDSDPLNRHPKVAPNSCRDRDPDCNTWDLRAVWVDPGYLQVALIESALPAFLLGAVFVNALGRLGISEVTTFMVSMPPLIFAWYYFVAWLIHRMSVRVVRRYSQERTRGHGLPDGSP